MRIAITRLVALGAIFAVLGFLLAPEARSEEPKEPWKVETLELAIDGKRQVLPPTHPLYAEVASAAIDLLATSDDTLDCACDPSQIRKWRDESSWVELVFDKPTPLTVGYCKGAVFSISKIWIILLGNKTPGLIWWCRPENPEYGDYDFGVNTKAGTELFDLVESCSKTP